MKKIGVLIVVLLLSVFFVNFIHAQDEPSSDVNVGEEDMEKIQGAIDKIPIDDETGGIDKEKLNLTKSKAEERIDAINLWLEDNASWLKVVFGMVPEISWVFVIVLYFWLLFFVNLVLNGNIWGIIISNKTYAKSLGFGIFIVLVVTKIMYYIGLGAYNLADTFWNKILPYGIVFAVIVMIIFAIVLVVLAIYAPGVLLVLKKKLDDWREKKAKEEQELDRKVLHTEIEAMQESSK